MRQIDNMTPNEIEMLHLKGMLPTRGFPLQLKDTPPESERQILRCAPPFDAQAEHEADLRYESRVDAESWNHGLMEENDDENEN
jgi:hypothetical protein